MNNTKVLQYTRYNLVLAFHCKFCAFRIIIFYNTYFVNFVIQE